MLEGALGSFAFARARRTAAGAARAANRAAIGAHGEVDGAKVASALLAIRLATAGARAAIDLNLLGALPAIARAQIFADDRAQERARTHRANLEQSHLFLSEPHLRDGIVNDNAQFGMAIDLKRIGTHGGKTSEKWSDGGS